MHQHQIPFRPQQLRCDPKDLEHLLWLRGREIVRWHFTPFGDLASTEPLSKEEIEFTDFVHGHCGKNTQRLLPHVIAYLRTMGWNKPYMRSEFTKTCFRVGGTQVLIGRPLASAHELDWLTASDLLLVPHVSAAGPNGIWHIERGDQHPFVLAAGKLQVWTLSSRAGQPDFYYHLGKDDPINSSSARGVDLFTTLPGAQDWIKQGKEDGEPVPIPKALTARELLSCLARVDVAAIDTADFAVTWRGRSTLGCDAVASAQELLQALAG